MHLNKFLAQAGVASRRNVVELIQQGMVTVNGTVVTHPAHQVTERDVVTFRGKVITPQEHVYILLNKPAGVVTTVSDERGRRTVLDVIKGATKVRVVPVGRLDINTTGLLLLTNDGQLAQQLAHPKYEVRKVYAVTLDKPIDPKHGAIIKKGFRLKDGPVRVDAIKIVDPKKILITLHSGKHRIVRRIFEHFGYRIKKLERTQFAGLSTRGLAVGQWRVLKPSEIKKLIQLNPARPERSHVVRQLKDPNERDY